MDLSAFVSSDPATRRDGWSPERKLRFLEHLSHRGNVRAACASVGMSRETAYTLRRRDPLFARGWNAALLLAREASVEVLADRAIDGVEEKVYYRGELVDTRRKYDTRLLLAHVARLDRIAEHADARALGDAARFDAILGCIAGAEVPSELAADEDGVPLDRNGAVAAAECRTNSLLEEALCELEAEKEDGLHTDEEFDEGRDELIADLERVPTEVAARWDGWFGRTCATVDAVLAGAEAADSSPRTVSEVSGSGAAEQPASPEPESDASTEQLPHAGPEEPCAEAEVSSPGTVSEVSGSSRAATARGPDGRLYAYA